MKMVLLSLVFILLTAGGCAQDDNSGGDGSSEETDPADVERVPVEEARAQVQSGDALLVCAYDNEERCLETALEGSITSQELEEQLPTLPMDQLIIFYCT